ncbi:TPA: hypothetical protein MB351_000585 [Klebsiella pneumoniae]|nr:hypothetical protein [Klebsiella pneumoniae]USC02437.1 hypothetical protein KU665_06510 [Klebsiella pneumoniae]HBT4858087.1 hypothetical protein [Klebsiella pneumoniae]HBT4873693.1 hypothetical protein [Klebsiella pneumoniae]
MPQGWSLPNARLNQSPRFAAANPALYAAALALLIAAGLVFTERQA